MDAQSAKTTGVGGEQRGYDGGKKVNGRKRQVLVDTEGLVVKAKIHSAKGADQDGLKLLLRLDWRIWLLAYDPARLHPDALVKSLADSDLCRVPRL